jgi:glycosyltransferase involved in cell wall biosynthesis
MEPPSIGASAPVPRVVLAAMPASNDPLRILVVGHTPPPVHGQAVMIQRMLGGRYERIRMFHVRMAFSERIDEVGRFALRKVWILFRTIIAVAWARVRHRATVLYYPPSGPNMVPMLRDIVLLNATRWMFRRTVFHYHAGGVCEFAHRLPAILRPFFRSAYHKADLAIRLAPMAPEDGRLLKAKDDVVVVNGIPDDAGGPIERHKKAGERLNLLFTAVLVPSKGVMVLLEALKLLRERGVDVELRLMGQWGSADFERECLAFIEREGLQDRVRVLGLRGGAVKQQDFREADLFCFPSHYENEVNPVVLMEALSYSLPIVTTRWRGIPAIVQDGENGLLVEPQDPVALADAVQRLVLDPELRNVIAQRARRIFEERYTLERHLRDMEEAFLRMPR